MESQKELEKIFRTIAKYPSKRIYKQVKNIVLVHYWA